MVQAWGRRLSSSQPTASPAMTQTGPDQRPAQVPDHEPRALEQPGSLAHPDEADRNENDRQNGASSDHRVSCQENPRPMNAERPASGSRRKPGATKATPESDEGQGAGKPAPSAGPAQPERRSGRIVMRRGAAARMGKPTETEDEKLLERRPARPGRPDFIDGDPWRALRILSEFVEGFDALASGRAGGHDLRLGPGQGGHPRLRARPRHRPAPGRGGLRDHHRRRARDHGGGEPRLPRGRRAVDRLQHRAAPRAGPQPVRRPGGRVPLLLRPQDDVREVRRCVRHPARAASGRSTSCSRR